MCVAVPGEVISIHGAMARIRIRQTVLEAESALVDHLAPGDRVLVHAGFIIEKLDPEISDQINDALTDYSNIPRAWEDDP